MFLATAVAILGILLAVLFEKNRRYKGPPGPWGFPILGHLPLMGDNPAKKLMEWKTTYGPIISVRFGSLNTVVFNEATVAKEAFNIPSLNGRKCVSYFGEATNKKGIIFAEGPPCFEQRRFVMKAIKDFSPELENTIQTEISELLNSFKMKSGQPLKVHHAFNISVVNSVWLCITGSRFEVGDPNLKKLTDICTRLLSVPTGFEMLSYFIPVLSKLFPNLSGYNSGLQGYKDLNHFIETHTSQLDKSRIRNQPRNLADAYMDKVDETSDENSSFFRTKGFQTFTYCDLFLGGMDSTSTLLEWTLAYLAVYPEVQIKLQKEIFEATGNTRLPCLNDRSSMPFTEAVGYEIIRKAPLVSFNVGKKALDDTLFRGYIIPKGTMIYANFYGICIDPAIWGDPENFRPERFIDDKGKFRKPEEFAPFSWGKRTCVGDIFAKDEIFLYIARLFQTFDVTCVPGKEINLQAKFGIVMFPDASNEVILTERI